MSPSNCRVVGWSTLGVARTCLCLGRTQCFSDSFRLGREGSSRISCEGLRRSLRGALLWSPTFQGRLMSNGIADTRTAVSDGAISMDRNVPGSVDLLAYSSTKESPAEVSRKQGSRGRKKPFTAEQQFKHDLDMCSRAGDMRGALALYEYAKSAGIRLSQYHYNAILYCCTAALPLVPGDSAAGDNAAIDDNILNGEPPLEVSEAVAEACERGVEVYRTMLEAGIQPNVATYASVSRLAAAVGDGDTAFLVVRQMADGGIEPRLRSYRAALNCFVAKGQCNEAFKVLDHMLSWQVEPQEAELAGLLRVATAAGDAPRAYVALQQLRVAVRECRVETLDLVRNWFGSDAAALAQDRVDKSAVLGQVAAVGGGWHGLGWMGKGKWHVKQTLVDGEGRCGCCGERLAQIDLDPVKTTEFAKSLAALAEESEGRPKEFQKFQKWLEEHGPFDAVIDGANTGLREHAFFFNFTSLEAVCLEMQRLSPRGRLPLVLVHHMRTKKGPAEGPEGRRVLAWLRANNAIFTTPSGSNDDWYWLYAAVKNESLLVTADEMRDHIFSLLGNDYFPKWKERHQVRFHGMSKEGPVLQWPPPYSTCIQESSSGNWHVPGVADLESGERTWICISRSPVPSLVGEENVEGDDMSRGALQTIEAQESPLSSETAVVVKRRRGRPLKKRKDSGAVEESEGERGGADVQENVSTSCRGQRESERLKPELRGKLGDEGLRGMVSSSLREQAQRKGRRGEESVEEVSVLLGRTLELAKKSNRGANLKIVKDDKRVALSAANANPALRAKLDTTIRDI